MESRTIRTAPEARAAAVGPRIDVVLLAAVFGLCALGVVMVYSSSAVSAAARLGDGAYFLKRQLVAAAFGLGALLAVLKLGYRRLAFLAYPALLVSIVLLVAVLLPGIGSTAGGARRWIRLPGFSLQPGELAKLGLVLYLAYSLAKKREKVKVFSIGFLPHCVITGLLALLVLGQPDFGSAVSLAVILFVLLFAAGTKLSYLVGSLLAALPFAYHLVASSPYRMKRIMAFLDPWTHRHDIGYQVAESLMSIGSGGLFGLGLGDGRQKLFFLPEAHTDFIFSIIGEELGLIGVVGVIALYAVVVWRGIRAALNATEAFGTYLALGITVLIGFQAVVNMAVAMGMLPTKGLTLPFVSYGGTSLVVSLAAAGVLLSISQSRGGFLRPQMGGAR
ncbi:MAG: putative lipid II flippase FtsW [Myxococcales bacterium]|jgi:cell division protein FtsW